MKILDTEVEFDFYDADMIEKFEDEHDGVDAKIEEISERVEKEGLRTSQAIRETCQVIFEFFDNLLGEGSYKKIFGQKTSLTLCKKAFNDFVAEGKKQKEFIGEEYKEFSPNRATRRAKGKK